MTDISVEIAAWKADWESLIEVRRQVFINEQGVPEELEIDDLDPHCLHVKSIKSETGIIGTARLLPSAYIGRMCVLRESRNHGAGGLMLSFLIDYALHNHYESLMLNAQTDALPFYQRYGFKADSEIFMEAGIKHRHMTLTLAK
jgi:predicted GNAT family N-acyltransferase